VERGGGSMGVCLVPLLSTMPWLEEGMPWVQDGSCWVHRGGMAQLLAGWLGWMGTTQPWLTKAQ
jgi:hypothetical protein